MAQFALDDKVSIPATVVGVTENQDGIFYELKFRAINTTKTINVEESDIVARNTTTTTDITETTTDTTEP